MRWRNSLPVKVFLSVWLLASFVAVASAQTDSRVVNDRYVASYRAYQAALVKGAPSNEVQKLLGEYENAKAAFNVAINASLDTPQKADANLAVENLPSGSAMAPEGVMGAPLFGTDKKTVSASVAIATSSSATEAPLPTELQCILENLYTATSRKSPDTGIQQLERYISLNPRSAALPRAKYELARAYEWLKNDAAKSTVLLQQLANDPNAGTVRGAATSRLKYLAATKQHAQWKQVLDEKAAAKDAAYASFHDVSYFAIPVKVFRYGAYFAKMISFQKAQSDYKSFQISYEALAALFTPPPEVSMGLFKTADGKTDSSGAVRLIYTNSEAWFTRWKLISEAKSSIDIQYFIVDNDVFGMSLSGLLLRKAREGVKIRFLIDARGTTGFSEKIHDQNFMQVLSKFPNVEVKVFNPIHQNLLAMFVDLRKIMASNHDKIIVVDKEFAIIGGRNIAKEYLVDPVDYPTAWRDCDVLIKSSEISVQLDQAFCEEFTALKQFTISEFFLTDMDASAKELDVAYKAMDTWIRSGRLCRLAKPDTRTDAALKAFSDELVQYKHMTCFENFDILNDAVEAPIKIMDKNSLYGSRNDIIDQLVKFIDGARREIIIQNPYIVLTERAEAALIRASKRGIPIYMHTNSPVTTDSAPTQAMFYRDWKDILRDMPTCRIFVFAGKQMLHAKTFVFDAKIGVVGTYNMDFISEEVNSEVVAAVDSVEFARQLRAGIMSDIAISKEYRIKRLANGEVEAIFGPDDLSGKSSWLIRTLSTIGWLKPLI
ncbi:MAG: phosphatidylserine/phosphatidylglycerophosphate/cardiolipin synthase family protein [Candidatus Ozemobacteraceae bacterium]